MSPRRYARVARYSLQQWPRLLAIALLSMSMPLVAALQPWPLKILIDHAIGDKPLPATAAGLLESLSPGAAALGLILAAALASLLVAGLGMALEAALIWSWAAAGQRMIYALAEDLFRRLQKTSLLFHGRRSVGDILTRLTGDTWCVYTVTDGLLVAPAQHLLTIATIGLVAWQLDPALTLVALAAAPVLALSAAWFGGRLKRQAGRNREAQARLASFSHRCVSAVPLIQAYGAESRNRRHYQALAARAIHALRRNTLFNQGFTLVNGSATSLGAALVLFVGGQRVLAGQLSLGSLLVFVAYLRSVQGAVQALLRTYGQLRANEASVDRVLEVLDNDEVVRERPDARAFEPAAAGGACLRLEDVHFGYRPGRPVLDGIDLEIGAGETLALVGRSGAGKSTLVSLLPRFFDPDRGRVLIDGQDLRDLTLDSLRSHIALVLQEPFLMPLSLAENIAYGRPEASREEIVAAAVAANAHDFIGRLPEGYDTVLGERGVTLSGGERQRLSIARALLKNAPVLILDEPTSALDAGTEAAVMQALQRLMRGRTVVIIAHRLSTVRRASRIAVIDAGRVVETGSHEQLMAAAGAYHRLYALQFAPAPEEGVA